MGTLFGTDGVRGLANRDVTAELALDLAVSAAHVLANGTRPTALVGRDPRASGEFLSSAVQAGLASAGVDVVDVGVLPTPAVAFLTKARNADFGVMLSASHNAMPDNGIKFFNAEGNKLADAIEDQIEARLREQWDRPIADAVGRIRADDDAADSEYVGHLVSTINSPLNGLRVVVDGANGAASYLAPLAYREAGAEVIEIHCAPDGYNINAGCGSTHMGDLQAAVLAHRADIGIAHDGDADRCLAVDAAGNIVDGDQLMAIIAIAMRDRGQLAADTVVSTVMANLGFRHAMARESIEVVQTAVGDRYVLEAMLAGGYVLGGEQSGHVVMSDHATTGDGLLTALQVMSRMSETGKPLAELAGVMKRLPQVLINVPGVDKDALESNDAVADAVRAAEAELADSGRVLLRKSGTEPLVRVMVEAPDHETAESVAASLAQVVQDRLSL